MNDKVSLSTSLCNLIILRGLCLYYPWSKNPLQFVIWIQIPKSVQTKRKWKQNDRPKVCKTCIIQILLHHFSVIPFKCEKKTKQNSYLCSTMRRAFCESFTVSTLIIKDSAPWPEFSRMRLTSFMLASISSSCSKKKL